MNLGTGNRNKTILAAALGAVALGACFYIYEELFATANPAPAASVTASPAPPRATGANPPHPARAVAITLDPTLHMQAMLVSEGVTYSGAGRNIFSAQSAPPLVIPQPVQGARPGIAPPPVPCPPNCPPPAAPPPIDLKFFGIETAANGIRQAFLLHGEDVYLASAGDVVLRRYKVLAIDPRSIRVQDMQSNSTQTLPLLTN
jgi:hypothetical protein